MLSLFLVELVVLLTLIMLVIFELLVVPVVLVALAVMVVMRFEFKAPLLLLILDRSMPVVVEVV